MHNNRNRTFTTKNGTKQKKRPLVSIVIVNYNGKKFIEKCLNSVFSAEYFPYEVIVVDNGSSDNSCEIIEKRFKKTVLIKLNKNMGPAKGRNVGAKRSRGKYLVFLDYDTEVNKNWLEGAVKFMEKNPVAGGGQFKLLKMDGKNHFDSVGEKITKFGFLSELSRGAKDVGQFNDVIDIFSGKTAAMIVKKRLFEKIGGFDEKIFMYWEEPDLCWRIWKSGYRVLYLPMGSVLHAYGTKEKKVSEEHSVWITYQGCKNQLYVIYKNAVGRRFFSMFGGALLSWTALMVMFALKGDFKKSRAVGKALAGTIKGVKVLRKARAENIKNFGKEKFNSDNVWFKRVEQKRSVFWYIGKGVSYLTGREF